MKKSLKKTFIILILIVIVIGGVAVMAAKKERDLYNSHSWKQTEATFSYSSSYTEKVTRRDAKHNKYTEKMTYYKWFYTYQINGETYECSDNRHSDSKPSNESKTITILVAEDDASLYLMYENEEEAKKSFGNNIIIVLVTVGIVFLIFLSVAIKKFLVNKTKQMINKISDN